MFLSESVLDYTQVRGDEMLRCISGSNKWEFKVKSDLYVAE